MSSADDNGALPPWPHVLSCQFIVRKPLRGKPGQIDEALQMVTRASGKRGKRPGVGAILQFLRNWISDSFWGCRRLPISNAELKALVAALLAEVAALQRTVGEQREEIARLKGLKGRPAIRPSGMEKAGEAKLPAAQGEKRSGGGKTAKLVIHEERVVAVAVPAGSRCKGHASFVVRSLVLRRFVLAQCHQGQVTVARLVEQLRAIGIAISKRQVVRLLIAGKERFVDEARDVLRAGLTTAAWITVDDTGARHNGANGVCTQIGNDHFTWFGTTASKSRRNFLDLLRAGHAITSSTPRRWPTCAAGRWPGR